MNFYSPVVLMFALAANAQVIKTEKPPVVFLNGYQSNCSGSQFSNTFGKFDQIFQTAGRTTLFFDNCMFGGKPTIEELGNDFRDYLAGLKYSDGSPVTQVDIVAHSMGGLIVRSYLAGKQPAADVYLPPANPGIRKIVFLATPHFGSPIAIMFGLDNQGRELASGGLFVFDLGTWNQGTDDLRGIDSLALIGNVGTGQAVAAGFDDGVVGLTSASIAFAEPGHTRVVPYCHTGPGLVTIAGLCPPNAPGIAIGVNATDANAAATLSFLNDTPDWQSIGQSPSTGGGLIARAKSADDQYLAIQSAKAGKDLNIQNSAIAWTDLLPAGPQDLMITTPSGTLDAKFVLQAGYTTALTVKSGPFITRVLPSAAALSPLAVAPGMFVAIYGSGLAGVQVRVGGVPAALQFVSDTQVNVIVPDAAKGLTKFTVANGAGTHTVNVLVQPAVPAIYTQNQSGTGPAAALNALTNILVTSTTPLHASDYVSLYLTGLGTVHAVNGLQFADNQPAVSVGGKPCRVTYAGRAPGYDGLDQINCQLAPDIAPSPSAQVAVSSAGRTSNIPTLAIQ